LREHSPVDSDVERRVFELASSFHDPELSLPPHFETHGSVTVVDGVVEPLVALNALRSSALARLVPPDDAVLNHPERPWPTPITPIRSDPSDLTAVNVMAQTWVGHLGGRGRAAELSVRVRFGQAPVHVDQVYALYASDDRPPVLSRSLYDFQRAETGYDGDDRVTSTPSPDEVDDFVDIVRQIAGVT
jgi:hypothetical protein